MILQEYINQLQEFVKNKPEYAQLKVIYAADDEGNDFQHVCHSPSVGVNSENDEYYAEFEPYDPDEHDTHEVNCICIN